MTSGIKKTALITVAFLLFFATAFTAFSLSFRRPYRKTVLEYATSPALAFAVIKAESGFSESAVSEAGAVGLMQLMPSTAQFVCEQNQIEYKQERLYEGEYNVKIGCLYLNYLLLRFSDEKVAIAAYNAGEGTVSQWLKNAAYSDDEVHLKAIPYPETKRYVKKVLNYQKIYAIFD